MNQTISDNYIWLDRKIGLSTERLLLPKVRDVNDKQQTALLNKVIDRYVTLAQDHCWLPDAGGHGVLYPEWREELCPGYLNAIPIAHRAYVQLRLLGKFLPEKEGGLPVKRFDSRSSAEFRLNWTQFVELNPQNIDGIPILFDVKARWALGLAILFELAPRCLDSQSYYKQAVKRFSGNLAASSRNTGSDRGKAVGKFGVPELGDESLRDDESRDLFLARITLHVVCSHLYFSFSNADTVVGAAGGAGDPQPFAQQWMRWFEEAVSSQSILRPACNSLHCDDDRGMRTDIVARVTAALRQLRPFGGTLSVDPGEAYPGCFRPLGHGRPWTLDEIESKVSKEFRPDVKAAAVLGMLVVDKLMDIQQAKAPPAIGVHPVEFGFDWRAYRFVKGRMHWTRDRREGALRRDWDFDPGFDHPRAQLQRHFNALDDSDMIIVEAITDARNELRKLKLKPAEAQRCVLCTGNNQTRDRS